MHVHCKQKNEIKIMIIKIKKKNAFVQSYGKINNCISSSEGTKIPRYRSEQKVQ